MSEQYNKAIISRFYEKVWNEGDLTLADELMATNFVCHGSRGDALDREGYKRYVSKLRADLNFQHSIEDIVAEGDTVVARLTGYGETRRKFLGLNLGGKRITGTGIAIWKLNNGQITERWASWGPAALPL